MRSSEKEVSREESATRPRTVPEIYWRTVEQPKPDLFLQPGPEGYRPVSSADFRGLVGGVARSFDACGLKPGDRLAILSYNRVEWAATDYAAASLGVVLVPIHWTCSAEQVGYILADSGAGGIVVENPGLLEKVPRAVPGLKHVWLIEGEAPGTIPFSGLRRDEDPSLRRRGLSIDPDAVATILYTSGTTGMPRGVVLTHGNLVSNVLAATPIVPLLPGDVELSMLPLSHVFQKHVDLAAFLMGGTTAYAPSMERAMEAMSAVRPTVMAVVPRFLEKLRLAVMERVSRERRLRRVVFRSCLRIGGRAAAHWMQGKKLPWLLRSAYAAARWLALDAVREGLGGRLRLFLCGGAALPGEVATFIVSCGIPVVEGYGLTETSPVVAVNPPGAIRLGTAGRPLPGVEVRIAEDGEVLVRGPGVMREYYRRPEETAEALRDGWFHTGDIGEFDEAGYLKITDRKKDMFKTSGGKYVAPQAMENRLKLSPYIANALVVGAGRPFPACLIVPNFAAVENFARENGLEVSDRAALLRATIVRELFAREVQRANQGFGRPEQIKRWELVERDFSQVLGELTPTMKVVRGVVQKNFAAEIERLYATPSARHLAEQGR